MTASGKWAVVDRERYDLNARTDDDPYRGVINMPAAAAPFDDVYRFTGRFVAYPSEAAHVAHVLWIGHAHLMDLWDTTPRLAFLSAEKESGKTRALEISELLVSNPVQAFNVTPNYLIRKIGDEDNRPTILFDEVDTIFGPRAGDNEEVRGALNAGYRRGAVTGRCVVRGKVVETEEIPAFAAVALAGIGSLPDTVSSRSVIIRMKRRAAHEAVEPYRRRLHEEEGWSLRARLEIWAADQREVWADNWPALPEAIQDRNADIWEPLIAVAEMAGGDWPQRAREAAVELCGARTEESVKVMLLEDIKIAFAELGQDEIASMALVNKLSALEHRPWADWRRGQPISAPGVAKLLKEFGIAPDRIGPKGDRSRGYRLRQFSDAFSRYLTASKCPPVHNGSSPPKIDDLKPSTEAVCGHLENARNPQNSADAGGWTATTGYLDEGGCSDGVGPDSTEVEP